MGIIQYPATLAGEVGVLGATKFMVTTDKLSAVTVAGYLNNIDLAVYPIFSSDVISCLYSFDPQTNTGGLAFLTVSITNGIISLATWSNPGNVLLPVVDGDFAIFNGTTGQIKDSGITPSDPAKTKVASLNSTSVTANHLAVYSSSNGTIGQDVSPAINLGSIYAGSSGFAGSLAAFSSTPTSGSLRLTAQANGGDFITTISNKVMDQASTIYIPDPGLALANFILDSGNNAMAANSNLRLSKVVGTEAATTITLNGQAGVITSSSLTAGPGLRYNFTWSNTYLNIDSVVLLSYMGGTNTVSNLDFRINNLTNGSCDIDIWNHDATLSFNGTVLIGFTIF